MRVIKFIGLKVVEISFLVSYVEGSYIFMDYLAIGNDWDRASLLGQYVMAPLLMLLFIAIFISVVFGLVQLIKLNWKWANGNKN